MQKMNYKFTEEILYTSDEEVLQKIRNIPSTYWKYQEMEPEWRQRFMDFCMGRKTLPLLYDPFFKALFHPDIHVERLSDLLSSLLGKTVKVKGILPSEDSLLDGGLLVIMDILVELEDGSLANVEVQKIPYTFPGERISCYSADLVLRQYSRVKGEKGKNFKYKDIKKVYTIVLYEKSHGIFHEMSEDKYIHYGKVTFDTGLPLELLQEYCLVALDVFSEIPYPKNNNRLNGWLSLFTAETLEDTQCAIESFPWLAEIFQELTAYRHKPEEVLSMFSEALRQLDRNTVQYMIEEQQKIIEEQKNSLEEKDKSLEEKDRSLEEKDRSLEEMGKSLAEKDNEIARLKKLLGESL